MNRLIRAAGLVLAFSTTQSAFAISADEVLRCVEEKQLERWHGVTSYGVVKTLMGMEVTEHYQRTTVQDNGGNARTVFQLQGMDHGFGHTKMPSNVTMVGYNGWVYTSNTTIVGEETINERPAYRLRTEDINHVQQADGQTFELQSADTWIDKAWCVPLHAQALGTATAKGQSRPFTVTASFSDYRKVPNSNMFEPYRQTVKMVGLMDDSQKAELQRAQAELAKMDAQLASMPANQRRMMENMLGPQLKRIRQMASGGGFEIDVAVREIIVNAKPRAALH